MGILSQTEFPEDALAIAQWIDECREDAVDDGIPWDDSKVEAYVEVHGLMEFDAIITMDRNALFRTAEFVRQDDLLDELDMVADLKVHPIETPFFRIH